MQQNNREGVLSVTSQRGGAAIHLAPRGLLPRHAPRGRAGRGAPRQRAGQEQNIRKKNYETIHEPHENVKFQENALLYVKMQGKPENSGKCVKVRENT